jgi:hypothetical protein
MRQFRSFLSLLCLALLYWGCQKSDKSANHPPTPSTKPTTTTIYVPENVATKTFATDSIITDFQQLAKLLQSPSAQKETDGINSPQLQPGTGYQGYTKTYDCTTNNWTYVFTWTIGGTGSLIVSSGSGSYTIGTFSSSVPFVIISNVLTHNVRAITIQYTITVPNDANYCNSTTMQEMISFSYTNLGTSGTGTASNTESADPNVYQTYSDVVGGSSSNGNGTFQLGVTPGVLACGGTCHVSALGFPPTVTFYYSLEGSGTWQSFSQAGDDLNEFFITLPQAGTYDFYTQEDTAPGVLSGQLGSGSITVQ